MAAVVGADRGTRPASPIHNNIVVPDIVVPSMLADPVATRLALSSPALVQADVVDDSDVTIGQVKAQLLSLVAATLAPSPTRGVPPRAQSAGLAPSE